MSYTTLVQHFEPQSRRLTNFHYYCYYYYYECGLSFIIWLLVSFAFYKFLQTLRGLNYSSYSERYIHIFLPFHLISSHLHQHHLKTNIRGNCISLVDRRVGDTTCGYKAKDITPSIAWRGQAWKEEALDDRP